MILRSQLYDLLRLLVSSSSSTVQANADPADARVGVARPVQVMEHRIVCQALRRADAVYHRPEPGAVEPDRLDVAVLNVREEVALVVKVEGQADHVLHGHRVRDVLVGSVGYESVVHVHSDQAGNGGECQETIMICKKE